MPVTCNTADAPILVRYTFDGEWAARELLERRRELIRAGQLTARSAVLFDLRRSTTIPNLADLDPAMQTTTSDAIWPVCRAFIVNTPDQYDCARQLQTLLGPQSVINDIFQDESAALEWLAAMSGLTHSIKT